jgi:multidrug efflux pump subunit AcrA (membrane-fusion protein)
MKAIVFGLLLLSLAILFQPKMAFAIPASETLPVVQVKKIALTEINETLTYPARVESRVSASILAEMEGVVRQVVTLGTPVKKGQVLFKIQQLDPVYQYAPAKILAPVNGVVSQVDVDLGTQVQRGQKIGTVVDPTQLRVTIEIPGGDLSKLSKDATVVFTSSSSEQAEAMKFDGISPLVSSITGTATANLTFKSKKNLFSAGTIGKVQVTLKGETSIRIPEQAIIYKGADPFVRVLEGDVAKYKAVVLGSRQAGQVQIKKGLAVNDTLIERSSKYVPDNKTVKVEKSTL